MYFIEKINGFLFLYAVIFLFKKIITFLIYDLFIVKYLLNHLYIFNLPINLTYSNPSMCKKLSFFIMNVLA